MKSVYLQEAIRKAKFKDGKSNRQIASELGISRNTVKKVVTQERVTIPEYRRTQPIRFPVMGSFIPIIEAWLEADSRVPRKQQHTSKRIYDRLVKEHQFQGSERRVREMVAALREKPKEVYLPLAFEPGEMAQAGWIEDLRVVIAGRPCKVQVLNLVLNYSGSVYCEAFEHVRQEAFFQGQRNAFEFWGGAPHTVTYDNLKSAVKRILEGKSREENERFVAFRSTYLFDSRFCNPARGNEKGRVENMVKFVQRNLFTPIPQVDSLAELNALLRERYDSRNHCIDEPNIPLEEQLNEFMVKLAKEALSIKRDRAERERRERERKVEREAEERLKQQAYLENRRRNDLDELVSNWVKSKQIRQFIETLGPSLVHSPYEDMDKEQWLTWASGYADTLDPFFPQ